LAALRAELDKRGLQGFIVPRADEHQGEYVPKRAERLSWLTGFTGSAGLSIVLKEKAALFSDGRYTLQMRDQTDTKLFETLDSANDGPLKWLETNLSSGDKLGYDPALHTQSSIEKLRKSVEASGASLTPLADNIVDAVWADQPAPPLGKAQAQKLALSGEASEEKRARIAADIAKRHADAAVLTLPESICWLLNIRGADVPHTPFMLSFAILNAKGEVDLFVENEKLSPELREHFGNKISIRQPSEFGDALTALGGKTIIADPNTASGFVFDKLKAGGAKILRASDPCLLPKACKNKTELAGTRAAHLRDGVALTKFLAWLAREAPTGNLNEIDAVVKLETFRHETGALRDLSFDSISGAGANGAIVHYRVTNKTNRTLKPGELFLIDSGGQYEDGTTDVTRTVAIGQPIEEMRQRFTLVLKGHIALATARFPEGTTGAQLDSFARRPLWEAGLDYGHGTGHGVGSYLSVHEGPQSISQRGAAQALMPGMICSNEPGYYKAGAYGIRIENLVIVRELDPPPGAEKKLLGFETITMAPLDLNLVAPELLTPDETAWLNAYHAFVREKLSRELKNDSETHAWLLDATKAI
jgi:Xaa-Pro aminopeptidase